MQKRRISRRLERYHFPHEVPGMMEIRTFAWGRVLAGTWRRRPVLIVQEWWDVKPHNTFYQCVDDLELEREIKRVRHFGRGDGGDADGTGVPAIPRPPLPPREAGDACPLPNPLGKILPRWRLAD